MNSSQFKETRIWPTRTYIQVYFSYTDRHTHTHLHAYLQMAAQYYIKHHPRKMAALAIKTRDFLLSYFLFVP